MPCCKRTESKPDQGIEVRISDVVELSMTGQDGHFTSNATRLEVVAPRHPIAAGLDPDFVVMDAPGSAAELADVSETGAALAP